MKQFHFYDASSGLLHSNSIVVNAPDHDAVAQRNCPAGHKIIEGVFDPLSHRVDIATGSIVEHQPPAPSDEHEWNEDTKRWHLNAAAADRAHRKAAAIARIAELEAQHQPRLVREILLGRVSGLAKLQLLDDEITSLRSQVGL